MLCVLVLVTGEVLVRVNAGADAVPEAQVARAEPSKPRCDVCITYFDTSYEDDPRFPDGAPACCLNFGELYQYPVRHTFKCKAGVAPADTDTFVIEPHEGAVLLPGDVVTYRNKDGKSYNSLQASARYTVLAVREAEGAAAVQLQPVLRPEDGGAPLAASASVAMRKEDSFALVTRGEYEVDGTTGPDVKGGKFRVYKGHHVWDGYQAGEGLDALYDGEEGSGLKEPACSRTEVLDANGADEFGKYPSCHAFGVSVRSEDAPERTLAHEQRAHAAVEAATRRVRQCACQWTSDQRCAKQEGYSGRCLKVCEAVHTCKLGPTSETITSTDLKVLCNQLTTTPTKAPCEFETGA